MDQIAMLKFLIEVLKNQMAIVEQQADDLKCCGNCKNAPVANIFGEPINSHKACPKWYPDGLTKEDRE